jgi:hypothetical protein
VDAVAMTAHLERRVSAISEPGAGSALLYLILKNNIAVADVQPRVLIVLFRDDVLTSPDFRVHGTYFKTIDEFAGKEDDFVLQRAIRDRMNLVEKTAEAYYPPYWARRELRELIASHTIYFPARRIFGCKQDCIEFSMEEVLGSENFEPVHLNETIKAAEDFLYTDENLNFDKQIDRSFLPEIIRICQEKNIKLILVRTKILRYSAENPEPRALIKYLNDLKNYARRHDVLLIDYAYDDRLSTALYADMYHLNQDGRKMFSRMLSEALESIVAP